MWYVYKHYKEGKALFSVAHPSNSVGLEELTYENSRPALRMCHYLNGGNTIMVEAEDPTENSSPCNP